MRRRFVVRKTDRRLKPNAPRWRIDDTDLPFCEDVVYCETRLQARICARALNAHYQECPDCEGRGYKVRTNGKMVANCERCGGSGNRGTK